MFGVGVPSACLLVSGLLVKILFLFLFKITDVYMLSVEWHQTVNAGNVT
jgi:hypothetical protein